MTIPRLGEMRLSKVLGIVEKLIKRNTLFPVCQVAVADRRTRGINPLVWQRVFLAQEILRENLPQSLVLKINSPSIKRRGDLIKNLILQSRVERFKKLLAA